MSLHLVGHEKTEHCFVDFLVSFYERRNDDGSLDAYVADFVHEGEKMFRFERVDYLGEFKRWAPQGRDSTATNDAKKQIEKLFQRAMQKRLDDIIVGEAK